MIQQYKSMLDKIEIRFNTGIQWTVHIHVFCKKWFIWPFSDLDEVWATKLILAYKKTIMVMVTQLFSDKDSGPAKNKQTNISY